MSVYEVKEDDGKVCNKDIFIAARTQDCNSFSTFGCIVVAYLVGIKSIHLSIRIHLYACCTWHIIRYAGKRPITPKPAHIKEAVVQATQIQDKHHIPWVRRT